MATTAPILTLKSIQIVHLALMAGVMLFLITTFSINGNALSLLPAQDTYLMLVYIAVGLAVVSIVASSALYNTLFSKIDTGMPLNKKLPQYFTANVVRWALLEGAALFNVVVFLLSGSLLNAGIAILLLAIMLSTRPSRQKVTDDLKISYPETLN